MASLFGDVVWTQRDLDVLGRAVRKNAASELSDADCEDITSLVVIDALASSAEAPEKCQQFARRGVRRPRYFERARRDVRRNRSSVDVSETADRGCIPLQSVKTMDGHPLTQRASATRSIRSLGVDADPMSVIELFDLINRLPDRQRQAVLLLDQGFSLREIGEQLGTSEPTTHRDLKAARVTLANAIAEANAA